MTIDRGAELTKHLERLDFALDRADPSAIASLARERRITLAELAEVPVGKGSTRDEIAKQRDARRAAANVAEGATRRGNKRSG